MESGGGFCRTPRYLFILCLSFSPFLPGNSPGYQNLWRQRKSAVSECPEGPKIPLLLSSHSPLRNRRSQSSWMGETDPQRNWELLILSSNGTIRTCTMSYPDCSFQEVGMKFKACFSVLVSSRCRELRVWGRKDFSHREIAMVDFFDLESVLITFSLWNFRTHRSFPFPSNVIRYTLQQAGPTLDCTSEHSGVHSDTVLGLSEGAESSVGRSSYCISMRTWIHSPAPLCK